MLTQCKRFLANENGATAIEYGLIAALISVALIAAFGGLGGALGDLFNGNESSIIGAMDAAVNS